MNAKINDKQNSDDWMSEEQTSDDRRLTKIYSWRTAWRSLLTKFFADENFLLYSIVFWLLECVMKKLGNSGKLLIKKKKREFAILMMMSSEHKWS